VALRPFEPSDAAALTEACQDREISRWTASVPWPYGPEEAQAWLSTHPDLWASGRAAPFAIAEAATNALLGSCGLHDVDRSLGQGQVGYWVAAPARNRGVATAAVRLASAWGFAEFGLAQIDLITMEGNETSDRVASAAGYRLVSVLDEVPTVLDASVTFTGHHWARRVDAAPAARCLIGLPRS
jgi:RimJ/RimL family protein N-acetyltransferase